MDDTHENAEELAKTDEITAFLSDRKATQEKTEKRAEQLAAARDAKAQKAAERRAAAEEAARAEASKPDDDDDAGEDVKTAPDAPDGEMAEFVAARKKESKDPVLKGKPKADAKPEAEAKSEPEGEPKEPAAEPESEPDGEDEEGAGEEQPKDEDPKKARADEAKKFAALARREKALVEREKTLVEREKATETKVAEITSQARQFIEAERAKLNAAKAEADKIRALFEQHRRSPRGLLEAAGFTVKDAVEEVVNDGPPQHIIQREIQRQIDAVREENRRALEAERKRAEEAERVARERAEAAAIAEFQGKVRAEIASNPDKYELVIAWGAEDRVWRTITDHFDEHGVIPDISEAAQAVEDDLHERSKKLRATKKFSAGEVPATQSQPAATPKQEQQPAARAKAAKTLTNSTATAPVAAPTSGDPLLDLPVEEAMEALLKRHRQRRAG